ncbi:TPA: hypothetical protein ACQRJE_000952 [Pseudomonas aeruginosa]|uniref:hypothetical protein n=1 Tax=Pseudomonas TaxID=286 RepID=UPI0009A348C5|nr:MULTISPECIES: hypothetical protein [Pseudomonas]EKW5129759.1 hypothetical protein [Pseudomonas aeruginosa]MBD1249994.1 hypothetical protein [Pseudomonas aeruginosa]MBG7315837.1 hypothetical protein [Pseudomonas aeruginosa]MBH9043115.1 hypothetical protein [Pseudomonas aeruginosa]MBI6981693.1 hypothetical protein [Pseudomonas aeruginosa]
MTHALFKQIDLTAKLGQDGSSLQAMNALRVIRETVAKHLAGTEGAGEIPLERALLALRTIAEFPCPEQDDLPAANMRQIALAALGGAEASSEPGNPGREPVSGPGNAGGRPHPAPGLARERDPLGLAPLAQAFNEAPAQGLKPSAFDLITGTANQPQDAAQDLPPLEEHLAQVEQTGAALHEDQANEERRELAEGLQTLERWLDRVDIEDGYVGVPVIEAVEVAANELRRLRQFERICEGLPQDAIDGGWTVQGIRGYAKRLEDQLKAALAQVEALRAELQSQRERNTELIFKLGSATNGWGRCEKERDAALARVAEFEAQAQHSVPEEFIGRLSEFLAQRGATGKALLRELRAMLAAEPTSSASPSCKWTESSGIWETGCGQTWGFVEDGPAENGALFCHHCGGRLVLIKSDDLEDDGEPCPDCMENAPAPGCEA